MCLDNLGKPRGMEATQNLKDRVAFKWMRDDDLPMSSLKKRKTLRNNHIGNTRLFIDGRWNVDVNKEPIFMDWSRTKSYPTGYHAYLQRKEVNVAVVFCVVEFDDMVATGYQDYKPVVVARKMRVLEVWVDEGYLNRENKVRWVLVRDNRKAIKEMNKKCKTTKTKK